VSNVHADDDRLFYLIYKSNVNYLQLHITKKYTYEMFDLWNSTING